MKRYATLMLIAVLSVALIGCEEKKTAGEPPIKLGLAPGETAPYEPAASPTPAAPPTQDIALPPTGTEQPSGALVQTPSGGSGLRGAYVVQKGDTLIGLARKFYGDPAKWKDIWNANRSMIPDPNVIKVGMKITLP